MTREPILLFVDETNLADGTGQIQTAVPAILQLDRCRERGPLRITESFIDQVVADVGGERIPLDDETASSII